MQLNLFLSGMAYNISTKCCLLAVSNCFFAGSVRFMGFCYTPSDNKIDIDSKIQIKYRELCLIQSQGLAIFVTSIFIDICEIPDTNAQFGCLQ